MILGIDVGNTNTVIGALEGLEVRHLWRVTTKVRTTDEFGLALLQLLQHQEISKDEVEGVVVCCVVPSVLYAIEKAARRYLDCGVLVVGRGIKTGMQVRTDNPREVGADRIVNSVAAFETLAAAKSLSIESGILYDWLEETACHTNSQRTRRTRSSHCIQ